MGYPTIKSSTPVTTTSNETNSLPSPISDDPYGDMYGDMYGELGTFDVEPAKAQIAPKSANAGSDDDFDDLPAPIPFDQMRILAALKKPEAVFPRTVAELANDPSALEALKDQIEADKASLKNGSWQKLPAVLQYTSALIDLTNKTHPELPIVCAGNIGNLAYLIDDFANRGIPRAQFIVRHDLVSHDSVVDYRLMNGRPSVISLESVDFTGVCFAISHNQLFTKALDINRDMQFAGIALEIQYDNTNCSIFALNLAKQAARHPEIMDRLHADNITGKISHPGCYVTHPDNPGTTWTSNAVLPKELMKHAQSRLRTETYMRRDLMENTKAINTKGQNLQAYQRAHFEMHEGQGKPASIVHKRIKYLEQLYEAATKPN